MQIFTPNRILIAARLKREAEQRAVLAAPPAPKPVSKAEVAAPRKRSSDKTSTTGTSHKQRASTRNRKHDA